MSDHIYDHDAVLDLWAQGVSSATICGRLKMRRPEAVRVIVAKARARGDARAVPRLTTKNPVFVREGPRNLELSTNIRDALANEAARRGTTAPKLAALILRNVIADNLFSAVLDA